MRKDEILKNLNAGENRYIISDLYNDVELDIEVSSIGIIRAGGHVILIITEEADINRLQLTLL